MKKEYKIGLSFEEIIEIIVALDIRANNLECLGRDVWAEEIKDLRAIIKKIRRVYGG